MKIFFKVISSNQIASFRVTSLLTRVWSIRKVEDILIDLRKVKNYNYASKPNVTVESHHLYYKAEEIAYPSTAKILKNPKCEEILIECYE
jgi:hypothetical protein